MRILTSIKQTILRVLDLRKRAEYIAPCRGCQQPPLITTFPNAIEEFDAIVHLTCVNPECPDPHFTSTELAQRTRAEAIAEWNELNTVEEEPVTLVRVARAGEVSDDLNVYSAEALRDLAEAQPDRFCVVDEPDGLTLYMFMQVSKLPGGVPPQRSPGVLVSAGYGTRPDDAEPGTADGDFIDEDTDDELDESDPLHRSSRQQFQKRRVQPPPSTRQNFDRSGKRHAGFDE